MEWERGCILASAIGSMERQLEESVRYCQERKQFGKPIGHFQSVSNRLVDMKLRLETARLLLYRAAWIKDREIGTPGWMPRLAKLCLSEAWVQTCLDAIQVRGGTAIPRSTRQSGHAGRHWRNAVLRAPRRSSGT
jgi:alkylation response protein AidB-like acyl-CoA dehydrogenase